MAKTISFTPRTAMVLVVIAVAGAGMGMASGALYRWFERGKAADARNEELRTELVAGLQDVGVGLPFPDFPLTLVEDGSLQLVRDLLPDGGVILYLAAACPSCEETLALLREKAKEGVRPDQPVLVIFAGDAEFIHRLAIEGNELIRVAVDPGEVLAHHFGLDIFPSYYWLDAEQVVTRIDAMEGESDEVLRPIL